MSTICKLDPTVRQARAARRQLCMARPMGISPQARPLFMALIAGLNKVRRRSNLTGGEKNAIFTRVAHALKSLQ